jgi:hypothetical protein
LTAGARGDSLSIRFMLTRLPRDHRRSLSARIVVLGLASSLVACACGARTGLADGAGAASSSTSTGMGTSTGTGAGGAGGSCATPACAPEAGPGSAISGNLYGSAGQQAASSVVVDAMGNVVLVGNVFGPEPVDFGCGPQSAADGESGTFVAKLDRCRVCVWSRIFGGAAAVDVGVSGSGDVVAAGSFGGGTLDLGGAVVTSPGPAAFVVALGEDGAPLSAHAFGGEGATSQASGVAVDASGAFVVAGNFLGSIDFGGTALTSVDAPSGFVGELDPSGVAKWSRSLGANAQTTALAIDTSGNVLVTGSFETPIDLGCGTLTGLPNHYLQPFVVKLDATGACVWSRWLEDPDSAHGGDIATDAASNVVVTGSFSGAIDLGGGPMPSTSSSSNMFIATLRADGGFVWGKGFGHVMGLRVATNGAGDVFFNGLLQSKAADFGGGPVGDMDALFIASLDAAGNHRWSKAFSTGGVSGSIGPIAADASSRVLLAGGIGGAIDFGCGSRTSTSDLDVFLAELAQ